MKNATLSFVAVLMLLSGASGLLAAEVDIDGATPGKWTMDLDAAAKLARAKKMPILLNFSGSDWCGWCNLMETNVFSKTEWNEYAKDNVLMVMIDSPKDEALVPAKYVSRNKVIIEKYGIEGYPTFVVIDDDGKTELGRLSAGPDRTPESFKNELQRLFRYRAAVVATYTKSLSESDRLAYKKIISRMTECREGIVANKQQIEAAHKKIEDLIEERVEMEARATEFRASRMGEGKIIEYQELRAKRKAAMASLKDWMDTKPVRSKETLEKFQSMNAEIQELTGKLSVY